MNGTPSGWASSIAEKRLTPSFEDWLRCLGIRLCADTVLQAVAEIILAQGIGSGCALRGMLESLLRVPVGAISHEIACAQPCVRVGVVVLSDTFSICDESAVHVVGAPKSVCSFEVAEFHEFKPSS